MCLDFVGGVTVEMREEVAAEMVVGVGDRRFLIWLQRVKQRFDQLCVVW